MTGTTDQLVFWGVARGVHGAMATWWTWLVKFKSTSWDSVKAIRARGRKQYEQGHIKHRKKERKKENTTVPYHFAEGEERGRRTGRPTRCLYRLSHARPGRVAR